MQYPSAGSSRHRLRASLAKSGTWRKYVSCLFANFWSAEKQKKRLRAGFCLPSLSQELKEDSGSGLLQPAFYSSIT